MFRISITTFFAALPLLACMFCADISKPDEIKYGAISGKILHPDNNLTVRIIAEDGKVDTVSRDPATQMFTFKSVKYGNCVLEVQAAGYDLFEEDILLDTSHYICDDIALIVKFGSITGKILSPDSNLLIRILPEDGNVDSTTRDPESKIFTFDNVKTGKCILQVSAPGYGFYEQKFMLNSKQLVCRDIVLARAPSAVSYLFPSNSQNFDSLFFGLEHSSITDTGIQIVITFNDWMDSASLMKVLKILPDSAGVTTELVLRQSLVVFFPYWKLATIDTARVHIGTGVIDRWRDTLNCDYDIFFPVDSNFIRATRLK